MKKATSWGSTVEVILIVGLLALAGLVIGCGGSSADDSASPSGSAAPVIKELVRLAGRTAGG